MANGARPDVHHHRHGAAGVDGHVGRQHRARRRRRRPTTCRPTTRRRRPPRSPARPTSSPPSPARAGTINAGREGDLHDRGDEQRPVDGDDGPADRSRSRSGTTFVSATPTGTSARRRCAHRTAAASSARSPRSRPAQTMTATVVLARRLRLQRPRRWRTPRRRRRRSPIRTRRTTRRRSTRRSAESPTCASPRRCARRRRTPARGVTYTIVVTNDGPSDAAGRDGQRSGRRRADVHVGGVEPRHLHDHRPARCPARSVCSARARRRRSPCWPPSTPTFAGASIVNTATATSTTADPTPANNSATATLAVTRSADVSIVKTGPSTITAGADVDVHADDRQRRAVAGHRRDGHRHPADRPDVRLERRRLHRGRPDGHLHGRHAGRRRVGDAHVRRARRRRRAGDRGQHRDGRPRPRPTRTPANNSLDVHVERRQRRRRRRDEGDPPAPLVAGGPITYTMVVTQQRPVDGHRRGADRHDPGRRDDHRAPTAAGRRRARRRRRSSARSARSPPGRRRTVTATGTIAATTAAGTILANTATVSSTSPTDPTPSNNTATASGTVTTVGRRRRHADRAASRRSPPARSRPTRVRVVNNGPSVARNVVATGQVPAGLIPIVGSSGGACVLTGQIVTCRLGDAAARVHHRDSRTSRCRRRSIAELPAGPIIGDRVRRLGHAGQQPDQQLGPGDDHGHHRAPTWR